MYNHNPIFGLVWLLSKVTNYSYILLAWYVYLCQCTCSPYMYKHIDQDVSVDNITNCNANWIASIIVIVIIGAVFM